MPSIDSSAHLYLGTHTAEPVRFELECGEVALLAQPCPTTSSENQDSAAVIVVDADRTILAVADGVGGISGGRNASTRALEVFATTVRAAIERAAELREAILDGFEAANAAVRELPSGCTTLAVAAIEQGAVRCFHVGDSAVLVTGQRGRLKHLTIAHSPVGYAIESGLLDEFEALSHDQRNIVSNVLGSAEMKMEIGPKLRLAAHDSVLVGSDGVFDNASTEEIAELIRTGRVHVAASRLMATCMARMVQPLDDQPSKPDDTTFVLYRPHRPSRSKS